MQKSSPTPATGAAFFFRGAALGRALPVRKKLTAGEKQRALDNIDEYYDHLNNQKYCKQAATYLADKSFENEYDD